MVIRGRPCRATEVSEDVEARVVDDCRREDVRSLRRLVDGCAVLAGLDEEARDVVVLLTSEVVTNVVVHGGPPARMAVRATHRHVHVEVADAAPGVPVVRAPDGARAHGRGMALVDDLASAWGVVAGTGAGHPEGKTVWFHVARAGAGCSGGHGTTPR